MHSTLLLSTLAAVALGQELSKPALTPDLDYLQAGNTQNLKVTSSTNKAWGTSTIPSDCKFEAQQNNVNPADIRTFNVTYSDCADPWVFCRHINSPVSLQGFINTFGRMPVHMRDWVKHPIALPNGGGAYNRGGVIVFFGTTPNNTDVHLHETGHSLDGQGAMAGYPNGGYSTGTPFKNAYNADSKVPDNYARTNYVEDFAQNVVVAVYDTVNPGGFPGVQPNYKQILNQYSAVKRDDNDQIVPGGKCNRRIAPSKPVPVSGSTSRIQVADDEDWTSFFSGKYDVKKPNREFSTKGQCKFGKHN